MSCFLKDHCNRFLSHCSAKVCDFFFSNTTNPERGKEKETILGVIDHFLDYTEG